MVEKIRGMVFNSDVEPGTCDEDDPGWIAPPFLKEPERLEDETFTPGRYTSGKLPSTQELFDIVDRPNRGNQNQRLRIAAHMARAEIARIAQYVEVKPAAVHNWVVKGKAIPIERMDKLARSVGLKRCYLEENRAPFPNWLQPWLRAVNGLILATRWMVAEGMTIPGVGERPPGSRNPFVHFSNNSDGTTCPPVPNNILSDLDLNPITLSDQYLTKLHQYLRSIPNDSQVWMSRYSESIVYLPFLPYVWKRIGLLVYDGELPEFKIRKNKANKQLIQ